MEGYRNVIHNCHDNAMVLKEGLENIGRFTIMSKDIRECRWWHFAWKTRATATSLRCQKCCGGLGGLCRLIQCWRVPSKCLFFEILHSVLWLISRRFWKSSILFYQRILQTVKKTTKETEMQIMDTWVDIITMARKINCC